MNDQSTREHSRWSASATSRNWNCPGALALIESLAIKNVESDAAAWGTACHTVAEECLVYGRDAEELLGRFVTTKERTIEVDEEVAECAQAYVDYVRNSGYDRMWVEQKFSLASLSPPFEAGGTADAVLYFANDRTLEIVDLKGGRGVVVDAKGNPQLRTYALGAMLAFSELSVTRVKVTIVQPRAPHKDGRIRSDTFHVYDLVEWAADLLAAMRKSGEALSCFDQPSREAWGRKYLSAGPHCKFCPALGVPCPAVQQTVIDTARVHFDDLDKPRIGATPDTLTPEQLSSTLDLADLIEDWVNAVRALAHTQAENGVTIPNYILVPKQGREAWVDEQSTRAALTKFGVPNDVYLNPAKLRTPKQVRDGLKKAGLPVDVSDLSATPETGTNLVRADKTARAAAKPKVQRFFNSLD